MPSRPRDRTEPAARGRGYRSSWSRTMTTSDNSPECWKISDTPSAASPARSRARDPAEDEFSDDLVFSDVIMPGMTAVELAASCASAIRPACVLTSGYSNVLAEEPTAASS